MDNSYRHSSSRVSLGFTLTEMLVAVAMGAMLIAAAAGIFSIATKAVGSSQANTNINNQLRVLHSWLDRDFARVRLDGPLLLYPQEKDFGGGNTRIDQACFLISGDIPSMPTSNRASLAFILYGPDSITNNASLNNPYEWVFTRRGVLIVGDSTVGVDIFPQSSFAERIYNFYTFIPSGSGKPPSAWPVWAKPNIAVGNEPHAHMLSNVISFKIVGYRIYDSIGVPTDVQVDMSTNNDDLVFYPTEPKPAWIEFEIAMRDSNNQLTEDYVSTYRVNLPSR